MSHWLGAFLIYILIAQDFTHSLRLVEVRIPNYVIKGSSVQLECLYDLDGDALYSVKWYKDTNEFYRYVPRDMPPAQIFLLPGVTVDLHNSSDAMVTLKNVNLNTAGRFRCEVSGEAPSFETVQETGDMVVVSLPDQGPPKISGGRPRYQIGDWVNVNCTAGRSKPAVQLSWFVNGEPAEPYTTKKYPTIITGRDELETSVLGLRFRVEQHHFRHGDMKLKCVASLSSFYWRSNEESVEGDRPQKAPVLESRETVYASNSRADPVQANKTDSMLMAHAPNILLLLLLTIITNGCMEHFFMWQQHFQQALAKLTQKSKNVENSNSNAKSQATVAVKLATCQRNKITVAAATTTTSAIINDNNNEMRKVAMLATKLHENFQKRSLILTMPAATTTTTDNNNNADDNKKIILNMQKAIQCLHTQLTALVSSPSLTVAEVQPALPAPKSASVATFSLLTWPVQRYYMLLLLLLCAKTTSTSASDAIDDVAGDVDLEMPNDRKQQEEQQQEQQQFCHVQATKHESRVYAAAR